MLTAIAGQRWVLGHGVRFAGEITDEDKLRGEFASLQDATARHFKEQSTKLDPRIADVRRDMGTKLCHYMLTAIAGQIWVLGHGVRFAVIKCAQSSQCRSALGKVTIYVYSEPSSSRGANSISHEMLLSNAIPAIRRYVGKWGLVLFSSFAEGGVVGAVPVQYLSLGVADYQVSTLVHTGDTTSVAPPHENLFDTTVLDEPANP
nr:hypothetical protein [Tanacetum cinerariifolium]